MSSPFSRWSLRNRLVLGVVILSTLGFTASGVVAQKQIESFLVHQIDDQLINVGSGALPRVNLAGIVNDEEYQERRGRPERDEARPFFKGHGFTTSRPWWNVGSLRFSFNIRTRSLFSARTR